jgi:hypothetical protein
MEIVRADEENKVLSNCLFSLDQVAVRLWPTALAKEQSPSFTLKWTYWSVWKTGSISKSIPAAIITQKTTSPRFSLSRFDELIHTQLVIKSDL